MSRPRTAYLSMETDAEYRARLTLFAPSVTPAAAKGVRVVDRWGARGEGVIVGTNANGKRDGDDVFQIAFDDDRGYVLGHRVRNQLSCLPLDITKLDSVSLDKIGDMCGLQRRMIERLA